MPYNAETETGFVVGFPSRRDAAASALAEERAAQTPGFTPAELIARIEEAFGGGHAGPRHFSPADRAHNPTAGWDPLDPNAAFVDPIEAARDAGFEEGFAAASQAAQDAAARDRALLLGIADALQGAHGVDREALAGKLRATVLALVTRIVGETGVSADLLTARVDAAAGLLADESESAILRLHPDDVALVEGKLPATVFAAGDAALARGTFVLESASTIVEDGPALWLDQLAAAIDHVALPAC
jgi:flagellar assembly protein FliH